jgi:hypothetical protein
MPWRQLQSISNIGQLSNVYIKQLDKEVSLTISAYWIEINQNESSARWLLDLSLRIGAEYGLGLLCLKNCKPNPESAG